MNGIFIIAICENFHTIPSPNTASRMKDSQKLTFLNNMSKAQKKNNDKPSNIAIPKITDIIFFIF